MGKEGFEPSRLTARDPKSRLSANSSTSPWVDLIISSGLGGVKAGQLRMEQGAGTFTELTESTKPNPRRKAQPGAAVRSYHQFVWFKGGQMRAPTKIFSNSPFADREAATPAAPRAFSAAVPGGWCRGRWRLPSPHLTISVPGACGGRFFPNPPL